MTEGHAEWMDREPFRTLDTAGMQENQSNVCRLT